jgi:hypothetical protein
VASTQARLRSRDDRADAGEEQDSARRPAGSAGGGLYYSRYCNGEHPARRLYRFFDDGRICLANTPAQSVSREYPLGRNVWLFAGSSRLGERAGVNYTLIRTQRHPQARFAEVPGRIADHSGFPSRSRPQFTGERLR